MAKKARDEEPVLDILVVVTGGRHWKLPRHWRATHIAVGKVKTKGAQRVAIAIAVVGEPGANSKVASLPFAIQLETW